MKTETKRAVRDAFAKLAPRCQAKNPVMFMVYLSACLTTALFCLSLAGIADAPSGYIAAICLILWATVLFGNFAESLAEGRGKAQADALRLTFGLLGAVMALSLIGTRHLVETAAGR